MRTRTRRKIGMDGARKLIYGPKKRERIVAGKLIDRRVSIPSLSLFERLASNPSPFVHRLTLGKLDDPSTLSVVHTRASCETSTCTTPSLNFSFLYRVFSLKRPKIDERRI